MPLTGAIHATLPAKDLDRARNFYEKKLGFTPDEVSPAGVWYALGSGTRFLVFPSSGEASGAHTQVGIAVDNIETTVKDLKAAGVTFEDYDFPGLKTVESVADIPNGDRAAWFIDSEGNLLGLIQRAEVAATAG